MWYRALLSLVVLNACTPPETVDDRAQAAVAGTTVVSLTFDDTHADNFQVAAMTEARGMRATFYINSGRVGQPGSMTLRQLLAMEAEGHEIAGHTISHARLGAISDDEVRRQVCNDRASLIEAGFRVTSFAYPFSSHNATVRQIVEECGYNSARLVGGLVTPGSCSGCPYGNPMPPPDPFQIRANDSVDETTTLDRMKRYVTQAEQNGGGWVPFVFHHVCDGCNSLAISPAMLAEFLDWLAARAPQGTVVGTVDEVMGGAMKPAVAGPLTVAPAGNMLQNPSLEADGNNDQIPDCWQRGFYGTNSGTYTLTNNAYDGTRAQRLDMTSYTSGNRRLASSKDTACAPAATPGRSYTVTARYIASSPPLFSFYYRNASGTWSWFAESARLPTSSSYVSASYTTPPLPSGATAISVGLSLAGVGSLTMDAFTLVDAAGTTTDTTPPTVSLTSPSAGATVDGIAQVSATASDASGVARVELLVNGSVVMTDPTDPYWFAWDTAPYAGQTVTIAVRAVDARGNAATSTSRQVTVAGGDATPPTVALTSPAAGATVSGTVPVAANASDASGIARVEFFANGTLIATELVSPYAFDWNTSAYAGTTVTLTARAVDNANNAATSAGRQVTVSGSTPQDTTPPSVALTSPANGATVSGTVQLAADAADASGIARVEFFANGTLIATELTSPYELAWDTSPHAGTSVTLTARAVDNANNAATSASRQVTVAGAASTNLVQNPSLEINANGDQVPDCWQRGGSGTNAATFTLTSNAFSGSVAQRIDMTSYTSGARRLVSLQDAGACAPAATAGRRYTVSARYIATSEPVFTIYYRNASGSWVWFAQSPRLPTSSSYTLGSYTTAPLPSGATAISVGLSIINLGSLTMDDFTLVDAGN